MIPREEQIIYNNHLAISKKCRDEPFKIRQNFDNFDEDKKPILTKLSRMFHSYPTINQEDFFSAPYKIFPDTEYFPLEYYTTQKAKSVYTQYIKSLETENPDSDDSLQRLKDGLKFVYEFCKKHRLTFETYPVFCENNIPSVADHLKNHKINYYVLHSLGITKLNMESRLLEFMFHDFYQTLQRTKNKFFSSSKMKKFAKEATTILNNKLKQQI